MTGHIDVSYDLLCPSKPNHHYDPIAPMENNGKLLILTNSHTYPKGHMGLTWRSHVRT